MTDKNSQPSEPAQLTKPTQPVPGVYRHFKGNDYRVIDVVRHSETDAWLVLYHPLYQQANGEQVLWVRPLDNFLSDVQFQGEKVPRFKQMA